MTPEERMKLLKKTLKKSNKLTQKLLRKLDREWDEVFKEDDGNYITNIDQWSEKIKGSKHISSILLELLELYVWSELV